MKRTKAFKPTVFEPANLYFRESEALRAQAPQPLVFEGWFRLAEPERHAPDFGHTLLALRTLSAAVGASFKVTLANRWPQGFSFLNGRPSEPGLDYRVTAPDQATLSRFLRVAFAFLYVSPEIFGFSKDNLTEESPAFEGSAEIALVLERAYLGKTFQVNSPVEARKTRRKTQVAMGMPEPAGVPVEPLSAKNLLAPLVPDPWEGEEWWCYFCSVGGNDEAHCRCCGRHYNHPMSVKGRSPKQMEGLHLIKENPLSPVQTDNYCVICGEDEKPGVGPFVCRRCEEMQ